MEDGEGWRVFLNGVQLGTVRPFVRHGLKDRKMYRAYRGISLIASEHDTRAAAVARVVRDASIPDPGG